MNTLTHISVDKLINEFSQIYLVVDTELRISSCSETFQTFISSVTDIQLGESDIVFDRICSLPVMQNVRRNTLLALAGKKVVDLVSVGASGNNLFFQFIPLKREVEVGGCLILIDEIVHQQEKFTQLDLTGLDSIVDGQSGGVVTRHIHKPDGSIEYLYVSKGIEEMSGVTSEQVLADPNTLFAGIFNEVEAINLKKALEESIQNMATFSHEWKIIHPESKKIKWLKGTGRPSKTDDGSILFDSIVLNITDLKESHEREKKILEDLTETNEKVKAIAEENKLLIKELQHRVKNNLQFILSIIFLKSRKSKNKELVAFTKDIITRLLTISQSYNQIYEADDLRNYSIKTYFQNLVQSLLTAYAFRKDLYDIHLDVEDLKLEQDDVITLGLLVNEIISNILKHAYHPDKGGRIEIKLCKEPTHYHLTVRDYGPGFEPGSSVKKGSIGLNLIAEFAKILDGHHSITIDNGVIIEIQFPIER